MITEAQLAAERRESASAMFDRADIINRIRVSDDAGGSRFTTAVQADVPCWRLPNLAGNVETQFGGQLQSGLQWEFAFPYNTNIVDDDEIVYGNERFAVMGVLGPRTHEMWRRVIAVKKGKA